MSYDMMHVTLDGTEMAVLAILKQKPDSSREVVADKISIRKLLYSG